MLLGPTEEQKPVEMEHFLDQMRCFLNGNRLKLLEHCQEISILEKKLKKRTPQTKKKWMLKNAVNKLKLREVGRARTRLNSNGLAPGTPETLKQLRDPSLRPVEVHRPIPACF